MTGQQKEDKKLTLVTYHLLYQISKLIDKDSSDETLDIVRSLMNAILRMNYRLSKEEVKKDESLQILNLIKKMRYSLS